MTTTPTTGAVSRRRVDTLTDTVLVLIVLSVGVMAGAASFNHVHDWTMAHSPRGTASWFGWANAVITELIPTAALIIIARRRRSGAPIGYPMFLLITAVALSLTAQLAVAEPSVFGWMVSALPACAFFALSKLVFTTTTPAAQPATTQPAPAITAAATAIPAPSTLDTVTSTPDTATPRPAVKKATPRKTPAKKTTPTAAKATTTRARKASTPATPAASATPTAADTVVASAAPVTATLFDTDPTQPVPSHLLPTARFAVTNHQQTTGRPITADELATRLSIAEPVAASLLADLAGATPATIGHANGSPTTVAGVR